MKLITYELPSALNYGYQAADYRHLFDSAYNKLLNIFETNRIPGDPAMCFVPAQWSPCVSGIMRSMLNIDPALKFTQVYEKYGKLIVEFTPSNDDEDHVTQLQDKIWDAQNRIDNLTHGLIVRKMPSCEQPIKDREWLLSKSILNTAP